MNEKRKRFAASLLNHEHDPNYRVEILDDILAGRHTLTENRPSPNYRRAEQRTVPDNLKVVPSVCYLCHSNCESRVYVDKETGRVAAVEGDPDSPQTHGVLCSKGLTSPDMCYSPKRLLNPLKRVGPRNCPATLSLDDEAHFVEISWEEALKTVADNILRYMEEYGPTGVAMLQGTRRGWSNVYTRLCYLLGLPNHGAPGWAQCSWPRRLDCTVSAGASYMESPDLYNTHCLIAWGVNPPTSWNVRASDISLLQEREGALIVVDPQLSEIADKADIWLQIRPDTDMALALTMIHIIIEESLTDESFIRDWTYGFEELRESVREYTPAWGSRVTGVEEEKIVLAARVFAKAESACIMRGLAIDQVHDSVQVCRALGLLSAITGNIGNPGGNVNPSPKRLNGTGAHTFIASVELPEEVRELRSGYREYPLLTQELSRVPSSHMPTFWQTVMTGEPYPVKCITVFGSNPVDIYTNAGYVQEALKKLEFLAVCDIFLTPTAQLADIILPASTWLERDNIISTYQADLRNVLLMQKAVPEVGNAKSDVEICAELARLCGIGDRFYRTTRELLDYMLEPRGVTFQEAAKQRRLYEPIRYYDYRKKGFSTKSGKYELYSLTLEEQGCDPLPRYTPSFQSIQDTPDLALEYPLIMSTGRHETAFSHTESRRIPRLLELEPKACLYIHPKTAQKYGIPDSGRVRITSTAGTAYAWARYTLGIREDMVQGVPGWTGDENINRLVPWGRYAQGIGTVCCRGFLCRVEPADEEDV